MKGIIVTYQVKFTILLYVRCEVKSIMDGFFIILRLKYTKYTLFVNLSNFQLQNFKSFFSEAGVPDRLQQVEEEVRSLRVQLNERDRENSRLSQRLEGITDINTTLIINMNKNKSHCVSQRIKVNVIAPYFNYVYYYN